MERASKLTAAEVVGEAVVVVRWILRGVVEQSAYVPTLAAEAFNLVDEDVRVVQPIPSQSVTADGRTLEVLERVRERGCRRLVLECACWPLISWICEMRAVFVASLRVWEKESPPTSRFLARRRCVSFRGMFYAVSCDVTQKRRQRR